MKNSRLLHVSVATLAICTAIGFWIPTFLVLARWDWFAYHLDQVGIVWMSFWSVCTIVNIPLSVVCLLRRDLLGLLGLAASASVMLMMYYIMHPN